jgi:hypothetical protein
LFSFFFGRIKDTKKSFRNYLTFNNCHALACPNKAHLFGDFYHRGSFNNYVGRGQNIAIFCPPPYLLLRGQLLYPERGQKQILFDPLILSRYLLNSLLNNIMQKNIHSTSKNDNNHLLQRLFPTWQGEGPDPLQTRVLEGPKVPDLQVSEPQEIHLILT